MNHKAIILRLFQGKGRTIAHTFSEDFGRIHICLPYSCKGIAPFQCIEWTYSQIQATELFIADQVDIIDAYGQYNEGKTACILRSIIETCLPAHAPSAHIWHLCISLLQEEDQWVDWHTIVVIFALQFFEQEGVDVHTVSTWTRLPAIARERLTQLGSLSEKEWKLFQCSAELTGAILEAIGVRIPDVISTIAKGGT